MNLIIMARQVSEWQQTLDELTEDLMLPTSYSKIDNSYDSPYVFNGPLKSSKKLFFNGVNYVNDNGVVIRLNLPESLYVLRGASKRFGMKLRHGSLRENLEAAYSNEVAYKQNVLVPFWVYTGEVIRRFNDKFDISRAIGADFVEVPATNILLKRRGKTLETKGSSTNVVPEIKLGSVLQTEIPTKSGYYSKISGVIPMNSELGSRSKESRGYFDEIYFDEQDLSVVRCGWAFFELELVADAGRPLIRIDGGVLGVWTDENPKK